MHSSLEGRANTKSIGLADVIYSLRRGLPLALIVTFVAVAVSVVLSSSMTPTYQASVGLLAANPPSTSGATDIMTAPPVDPRVYQRAVLDGPLIQRMLAGMDGVERTVQQLDAFARKVSVTVDNQQISAIIRITVSDESAEQAAVYANAIADELIEWDRSRARSIVDNSITALEQAIDELDAQLASLAQHGSDPESQRQLPLNATLREQRVRELEVARARGASAVMVGRLETLSRATVPVDTISPRPALNLVIAVALGLLVGYGWQFAAWSAAPQVRTSRRLHEELGLPVLAALPKLRRGRGRYSGDAIAYFRTSLLAVLEGEQGPVVGITSASRFDEKAGLAVALAESLARSGYRTLVVDGDLRGRGPGLGVAVNQPAVPSLDAYLRDPSLQLQPATVVLEPFGRLDVVPVIPRTQHASELMEYGFKRFIAKTVETYEYVVVDLAPVLTNPDASVAAPHCTGVVLCAGVTTEIALLRDSLEALETGRVKVLGTVITGATSLGRPKEKWERVDAVPAAGRLQTVPRETSGNRNVARVKQR